MAVWVVSYIFRPTGHTHYPLEDIVGIVSLVSISLTSVDTARGRL
jgi:hypothetical protein